MRCIVGLFLFYILSPVGPACLSLTAHPSFDQLRFTCLITARDWRLPYWSPQVWRLGTANFFAQPFPTRPQAGRPVNTVPGARVWASAVEEAGGVITEAAHKNWTESKQLWPPCQLAGGSALGPAGTRHRPRCQLASASLSRGQMAACRAPRISGYLRRWQPHSRVGRAIVVTRFLQQYRRIPTLVPTLHCPVADGPPWGGVDEGGPASFKVLLQNLSYVPCLLFS